MSMRARGQDGAVQQPIIRCMWCAAYDMPPCEAAAACPGVPCSWPELGRRPVSGRMVTVPTGADPPPPVSPAWDSRTSSEAWVPTSLSNHDPVA